MNTPTDEFEVAGTDGVETSEVPGQVTAPVAPAAPVVVASARPVDYPGGLPPAVQSPEELRQLQAAQLTHARSIRRGQLARRHPELAEIIRAAAEAEAALSEVTAEAARRINELDQQVADLTEINGRLTQQVADLTEQLEAAAKPKKGK